MPLVETELEQALSAALEVPLLVAVATGPMAESELTPEELARFRPLAATPRRDSWLRGRAALRRLRRRLGENPDAACITFPHPRYSLTHSGQVAVALGTPFDGVYPEPERVEGRRAKERGFIPLAGLGVDLEAGRNPRPEAARFFLTPSELGWLRRQDPPAQPAHLLRLWTVKEALFKADPQNRATGLLDYCLDSPASDHGAAVALGNPALQIRYASLPAAGGFLSAALSRYQEVKQC